MRLDELRKAWKRAAHFAPAFDGPYTAHLSPVGNNYARIVDAEDEMLGKIIMLHLFAEALNRIADRSLVKEDPDLCAAFGSFRSRMLFDPVIMPQPGDA